jgi:hypothetical protein
MKQKFGRSFILIPIGLFFIALTVIISRKIAMPDVVRGLSIGVGLGLMILAFILRKMRPAGWR